ncbi:MAG: tripartite tricarboxylate transporter TctB family protein [Rhodospirillales bacterium]
MFRLSDRLAGGAVLLGGIALLAGTTFIDVNALQSDLTARFFPTLVSLGLIACGLLLAARPSGRLTASSLSSLVNQRAILTAALFLVYCLTFRHVDFRLGTALFVLTVMWVLGARRPIELILTPLLVSASVFLLFRYAFNVLLPVWI